VITFAALQSGGWLHLPRLSACPPGKERAGNRGAPFYCLGGGFTWGAWSTTTVVLRGRRPRVCLPEPTPLSGFIRRRRGLNPLGKSRRSDTGDTPCPFQVDRVKGALQVAPSSIPVTRAAVSSLASRQIERSAALKREMFQGGSACWGPARLIRWLGRAKLRRRERGASSPVLTPFRSRDPSAQRIGSLEIRLSMSEVGYSVGSAVCSLAPTVGMCLDPADVTNFGSFLAIVASAVISTGFLTRRLG